MGSGPEPVESIAESATSGGGPLTADVVSARHGDQLTSVGPAVRFFNYLPLEYLGGGELSCSAIARGLAARGDRVEYVTDSGYHGIVRAAPEEVAALAGGVALRREPFVSYAPPLLDPIFRPLPPVNELGADGVDMLVLNRVPPPAFLRALHGRGDRIAFLLHGVAFDPPWGLPPRVGLFQSYFRSYLLRTSRLLAATRAHFQVFDPASAGVLRSCGLPSERIHVIPSGIPFPSSPVSPPPTSSVFRVLFVGRMDAATKGVDFLARILRQLAPRLPPDVEVNILGTGPDAQSVQAAAQTPRIRYRGFASEAEKRSLFANSHLLLVTSNLEAFGLVVLEGLRSGLLVLSTPAVGPASILATDPNFGRVLPRSAEAFVREILSEHLRWRLDPAGVRSEAEARQAASARRYDERVMVARYAELVDQIRSSTA